MNQNKQKELNSLVGNPRKVVSMTLIYTERIFSTDLFSTS